MENKPIKARPVFYAMCYEQLKIIARDCGYNLLINGSLNRDFDLVAIPWANKCESHISVLRKFCEYLGVLQPAEGHEDNLFRHSVLGGGRDSYTIDLNRGGHFNGYIDEQYYLDISFTPKFGDDLTQRIENIEIKRKQGIDIQESQIKSLQSQLAEKDEKIAELESEKDKWRLALEGLTPGGSEYYNDVERCVETVKELKASPVKHIVELKKQLASKDREIEDLKLRTSLLETRLSNYQHIENVRRGYEFDDSEQ